VIAGRMYTPITKFELASLPTWIVSMAGAPRPDRPEKAQEPISGWDHPSDIQRYKNWLINQAPEAHEGDGGDATTLQIAMKGRDFGVSQETALGLMLKYWNDDKAFPPWEPQDLQKKVQNAYKYSTDTPGNSSVHSMFSNDPVSDNSPVIISGDQIKKTLYPPRVWLLGHRYLPGYITLTVAPGGSGKSLLTILEGLSIASGKRLIHDEVKLPGAVWVYNTEDPIDEVGRRVQAAAKYYDLTEQDLSEFYVSSAYDQPLTIAAYDDRNRAVINEKAVSWLISEIKSRSVKLFIVDPFIECHRLRENDNEGINLVMQAFRKISAETGCAVSIVHHTSKGKAEHGNIDKTRGASSLASAVRIAHTFYSMTLQEAKEYSIPFDQHKRYVRLDNAKSNLSAPKPNGPDWFFFESVQLSFNDPETTGVLKPVKLEKFEQIDEKEVAIMDALDSLFKEESEMPLNQVAELISEKFKIPGGQSRPTIRRYLINQIFKSDKTISFETGQIYQKRKNNGVLVIRKELKNES